LPDHPLIHWLKDACLDLDHFVIFGSAPLLVHGLREKIYDLDVVARGEVWDWALAEGKPATGSITGDPVRHFLDGRIHFSERWISAAWDTDDLIDGAEIIEGLRFAKLTDVLRYKEDLLRNPKDLDDIRVLHKRLTEKDILLAG
jgi:hypothetical protein